MTTPNCPMDGDKCSYFLKHGVVNCRACLGAPKTAGAKAKPGFKKKPIPKHVREDVYKRDGYACRKCGSKNRLTIDHIIPESRGGKATIDNCQTLCKSCNSRKGDR